MSEENINNQIDNTGDGNLNMQHIKARDINITKNEIKTDISPEILQKRKEFDAEIEKIKLSLQDIKPYSILPENTADEDDFDIDWDGLMEAIEQKDCVVFIGQGMYTDENGKYLHEDFFNKISKGKIKYNNKDGFFMPKSEERVATKAKRYYNKEFLQENDHLQTLIEKLAQVKFPLIVNISPDNVLHKIYTGFNIPHNFLFYKPKTNQSDLVDEENDLPVIFNLLGNAADRNGHYIYTHSQFYDYINEKQDVKVPLKIEEMVRSASFYLFIGVDFDKWYNRLLFFALKFSENPEAYALDADKFEAINKEFINNQFNIGFVENSYKDFVDVLVKKANEWNEENPEPGVFRNLGDTFKQNIDKKLKDLKDQIFKSDTLAQLSDIEQELQIMKQTILKFTSNA